MRHKILPVLFAIATLSACKNDTTTTEKTETPAPVSKQAEQIFKNKGHELIYNLTQKVGDYKKLRSKNDVVYTYTYTKPDGKTDVSTEKYIFENELSYGAYKRHERTMPNLKGLIEQGYDGETYWLKHNGTVITDTTQLKRVAFSRPTNFYWFAMFQKLLDPGLTYNYLGETTSGGQNYAIVKVGFASTDNTPKDIYQLYINTSTGLVDHFLFTVADFGIMDAPFLMQVAYEDVDGLLIPTKRKYKKSDWNALVTDAPWTTVTWEDIRFNTGLSTSLFKK